MNIYKISYQKKYCNEGVECEDYYEFEEAARTKIQAINQTLRQMKFEFGDEAPQWKLFGCTYVASI